MIVYPNCKINLGLNILKKRADGYHDLQTVFYPIPLKDILEVLENKEPAQSPELLFSSSGLAIPGPADSNLCLKAWQLLKADFPTIPPVKIHLHKIIPIGAGLGGGSADGTFSLLAYNHIFQLGLSNEKLIQYAEQLGSDCPFFIINKPCFATGKGEILNEIAIDLSNYKLIIVNPGIAINTGEAFRNLKPAFPERSIPEIISTSVEQWKNHLVNDFEQPIFRFFPEIKAIKERFYMEGAVYASMSGSGSTVYGIFPKQLPVKFNFPTHYFVKELFLNS